MRRQTLPFTYSTPAESDECPYCKVRLSALFTSPREHIDLHLVGTRQRPRIRCLCCSGLFANLKKFHSHLDICLLGMRDNLMICDQCDWAFMDYQGGFLRHFYQKHHYLPYQCDLCDQEFITKLGLTIHVNRHPPSTTKSHPYKCDSCPKMLSSEKGLETHWFLMHAPKDHVSERTSGICKECGKFQRHLKNHMEIHSGKVVCDYCGVQYANHRSLTNHVKLHVPRSKMQFGCRFCNKRFHSKAICERHELCHSSPFICSVCGLSFTQQGSMEIHKRMHLPKEQWPFECNYCGQKFVTKWYKKIHEKKCEDNEVEL